MDDEIRENVNSKLSRNMRSNRTDDVDDCQKMMIKNNLFCFYSSKRTCLNVYHIRRCREIDNNKKITVRFCFTFIRKSSKQQQIVNIVYISYAYMYIPHMVYAGRFSVVKHSVESHTHVRTVIPKIFRSNQNA